jgi:hypothetical protein
LNFEFFFFSLTTRETSYEIWESIDFVTGKVKIFIGVFHVFGLFIPKKLLI